MSGSRLAVISVDRQALLRSLRVMDQLPGMKRGGARAALPSAVVEVAPERLRIRCGSELASVLGTGAGQAAARIKGPALKLLIMEARSSTASSMRVAIEPGRLALGNFSVSALVCDDQGNAAAPAEPSAETTLDCLVSHAVFGEQRMAEAGLLEALAESIKARNRLIDDAVAVLEELGVGRPAVAEIVDAAVREIATRVSKS